MAEVLPAPDEVKRSLVENMELAHENAAKTHYARQKIIDHRLLLEQLSDLEQAHRQATFGKDLAEVRRSYRVVCEAAQSLLRQINPEEYPDSFSQACLYYHDAQCVLNRPDEALLYARIAQHVLESVVEIESGYTREQRDNLEINAIRGEAVAYHNLGLDRLVPDILLTRACATSAYRNAYLFWEPLVKRDLIIAMVEIPRFNIREVNKVARRIASICEHKGDEFTLLLVREAWLRSFLKREKTKLARKIFQEEIERLPRLPYVGALHRALLFKSGADLAWKLHDMGEWKTYIAEAVSLMHQAGLNHQLELVRRAYGSSLAPILGERGLIDS